MYSDPLKAELPKVPQPYVPSYWQATAGPPPADDGPLIDDIDVDVAIIGAGYTGLSAAYELCRASRASVAVVEANLPGWGCSGRNGGFARPAIGRLSWQGWVDKWGRETARTLFAESFEALNTMRSLIDHGQIACDRQPDGWLKIAHTPEQFRRLQEEQRLLANVFGYQARVLDDTELASEHMRANEAHGALQIPDGFAVHPLKVAFGLLAMARQAGAKVYSRSPVSSWIRRDGSHWLQTPKGTIRARQVIIATNGYSTERLHDSLNGRLIPVLSSIVVTRPMTDHELELTGFKTTHILTDTRKLLNYYRKLPDNRIMLGSRGAICDEPAANAGIERVLMTTIRNKFPQLQNISCDYSWAGWVALTTDSMPRIHQAEDDGSVHYAIGYNGSGVSAGVYAGTRLAQQLAGVRPLFPVLDSSLPKVPFAPLRRIGQRVMFTWYRWQDKM